ncbi:hypothetical protein BST27_09420 [Mycobacterium intermedium]|uniref:Uncharacterized protein n=2 Tax=Mycobacterium TaxID=1763 RepID=A0A1X0G0A1_MYCIE|nr:MULTISPECIES: hypothetical protein [Mycobacterium]MCV6964536.1 hypothetical protein [Mycobacterium intermedium]MCV6978421.1 hypothetical protein [Mycobacterium bourgelatii]ORB07461.1 hypothetical protein BST27_09420 [Mycobacterium intermedium]GFG92065.1 hypothetical protein MBOU_41070 [Mycobacterium bourgelatii]
MVEEAKDLDDEDVGQYGGMSTANKIRVVQTVLAATVAAFAISVVVAGHWWTTPPPPPPPPLPPPSVNVPLVKQQVVELLQNQMNTLDAFKDYGITVADDLTLINTGLNKYDGLATVHTRKGTQKYLSVTVWADPTGAMFYQMDPTSAANLVEAARKEGGG